MTAGSWGGDNDTDWIPARRPTTMTPEDLARIRAIACDPVRRAEHDLSAMVLDLLDAVAVAAAGKPAGEMAAMVDKATAFDMCVKRSTERDAAEHQVAELDLACSKATAGWAEDIEKRKAAKAKLRQAEAELATLRAALTAAEARIVVLLGNAPPPVTSSYVDMLEAAAGGHRPAATQAKEAADDHAG